MRLYLDAAPVIYLVEGVQPYAAEVESVLAASATVPVTSDLTRLECRVKPLKDGDADLLGDFDTFFREGLAEIVVLSAHVIDKATEIRAQYGFKTPDAIHLAAAVVSGYDVFLTNDRRLDRFAGLRIEVVQR